MSQESLLQTAPVKYTAIKKRNFPSELRLSLSPEQPALRGLPVKCHIRLAGNTSPENQPLEPLDPLDTRWVQILQKKNDKILLQKQVDSNKRFIRVTLTFGGQLPRSGPLTLYAVYVFSHSNLCITSNRVVIILPSCSVGTLTPIYNVASFASNDSVDWSQFGCLTPMPNNSVAISDSKQINVRVNFETSSREGKVVRQKFPDSSQGCPMGGGAGAYLPGTYHIITHASSSDFVGTGPLLLTFTPCVAGVGCRIMSNFFGLLWVKWRRLMPSDRVLELQLSKEK